jgi:hypothetical protein
LHSPKAVIIVVGGHHIAKALFFLDDDERGFRKEEFNAGERQSTDCQ